MASHIDNETEKYYIGIDVGTSSVRGGLMKESKLEIVKKYVVEISIHQPREGFYEQSSQEIWNAVLKIIDKLSESVKISGIGFDATCSMVIVGNDLYLSKPGYDIIMWMDHRAELETKLINDTKHEILNYVGGQVSVEMQIPKLLWLKNNLPDVYNSAQHFFDLPDYLTWRATGLKNRSLCSLICKWNLGPNGSWDKSFFKAINLEDHIDENFRRLDGEEIVKNPGDWNGLTDPSSGISSSCSVATSLIDAHAGVLGLLSNCHNSKDPQLCLIAGTSACHMILSKSNTNLIYGVWGPYFNAILSGYSLYEGGQSSAGKLIDFIVENHPSYPQLMKVKPKDLTIYEYLENEFLSGPEDWMKTKNYHITPDINGNRSPLSDPDLKSVIFGLSLDVSMENLAMTYLAAIQSLAYGTRHIIDKLVDIKINRVLICGGLGKSRLFLQSLADVLKCDIVKPTETESVLLGSALLGLSAHKLENKPDKKPNLEELLDNYRWRNNNNHDKFTPTTNSQILNFHDKKYQIHLDMIESHLKYNKIMNNLFK